MTAGSWAPANDREQALAAAITGSDRRTYFQLIVDADLILPAFVETDPQARQRFLTMDLFGQVYLPVFTSPDALVRALGRTVGAYTVTTYAELRRKWPSPAWRLAINPGSQIDAYLTVDEVADAAGGAITIATAAELMAEGRSEAVTLAAAGGDGDGYVDALLDCDVFLPARRPVRADELLGSDFPWCLTQVAVDGPAPGESTVRTTIEVATMPGRPPEGGYGIVIPFTALAVAWPDPAYDLAVTTGGRVVTVPGAYLSALAVTVGVDLG